METIDHKIRQLPQNLQKEVIDFVDFLLSKKVRRKHKKPQLKWIGGLKEYRDKFTALELQKVGANKRYVTRGL
jgi:hypothetical protein